MLVHVLGPVRITDAGTTLPLPGAIPTRILALLTTDLRTGLRTDTLIDEVWGDAASAAASATLHSHVARLRRAVGAERVVTTAYGYRLALPPAAVDAHQFATTASRGAELLAAGRAAEAGAVLREALALWQGSGIQAYDGLDNSRVLDGERSRLGQLRLDALLHRIDADVIARCTRSLVVEVEGLLEEHPTNERLWALLVRSWQGVGEPAEALAAFARARALLLGELGLEPGAELRAAQAEVLRAADKDPTVGRVRRDERRTVAVVAMTEPSAEPDPEAAQTGRARLLAAVADEVARLDGRLVRTPGAVALAVFGAVTAREDDASRALLCAQRIARATGSRVGVTSGLALVTPDLDRLGAVADRAVALALGAQPGEVADELPAEPLTVHAGDPVPFVGRDSEAGRLLATIREAGRSRRAVVVPVVAEAGIGKSRLMAEVRTRSGAVDWYWARCDALGERGGLDPLVDALRGRAVPGSSTSRAETIATWAAALADLARDRTAVLCIEDAHWASELLLDLVDELGSDPVAAPLVVVVTARPEIVRRRPGWPAGSPPLRLTALGPEEITRLVDAVLPRAGAEGVDRRALVAASGGVPLFALELGRVLGMDAAHPIPAHLSDLMAARIDSLDNDARDLLLDAAVVGSTFWAEAVDADPAALAAVLQREFISEVQPSTVAGMHELRFRHDLLRDAAYGRLLRPDRAQAHLAVARWWQGLARGQDDAIIAEHAWLAHELFLGSALPDEAADLARTASRAAASAARGVDTAAAVTFLRRAASLVGGRPEEAAVLVELAEALSENRKMAEADQVLRRARKIVDPRDGPTRVAGVFLALQLDFAFGRPQDEELLEQVLADFPTGPVHIRVLGVLGVNLVIGQTPESFARAIEVADRAIAMARELGDEDLALLSFGTRGRARLGLGDRRGLADMDRAQDRGPGRLPPFVVLGTRQWYAGAAHHWSWPETELRIRIELEDYARRTGMEFLVSFGVAERLRCLWELGRAEECVAEADAIDRRSEAMTRYVVVQRALALADLGRLDDEVLAEVLATPPADDTDLRHVLATAVLRARHALDSGEPSLAADVLDDLGGLTAYASRDGACELLPRAVRLGREAGLVAYGAELADVTLEPTPLGRALTATLRGLVRGDAGLLAEAVSAWQVLGDSVDLRLARADASATPG